MNATHSYEDAVEKYLAAIRETRSLPSQPNKSLSTRRGRTWQLRNTSGLLATVADGGEVSLGKGRPEAQEEPLITRKRKIEVQLDDIGNTVHITCGRFGYRLELWTAECLQKQLRRILKGDESDDASAEDESVNFVFVDDVADDWKNFRIWIQPAWLELSYEELERLYSELQSIIGN
ncbi:hypothetical protein AB1L30_17580 [Bremerella sp. JC817]|uniref:hypothetical protein n=1 Tax=Bremerella sp. JC817 TaxID=3231756 RepID=UPI003457E2CB